MLQVVSSRPGRDESQKWWFAPFLTPQGDQFINIDKIVI